MTCNLIVKRIALPKKKKSPIFSRCSKTLQICTTANMTMTTDFSITCKDKIGSPKNTPSS